MKSYRFSIKGYMNNYSLIIFDNDLISAIHKVYERLDKDEIIMAIDITHNNDNTAVNEIINNLKKMILDYETNNLQNT